MPDGEFKRQYKFRHCGWKGIRRQLRAAVYMFNLHTMVLCIIGCLAVYICQEWGLSYNMDLHFMAAGTIFPLTFAISQAFSRRERALTMLAELKASIVALYWHHRDWAQDDDFPASLGDNNRSWAKEFAIVAAQFLDSLQQYICSTDGFESLSDIRLSAKPYSTVYLMIGDTDLHDQVLGESFQHHLQCLAHKSPGYEYLQRCYLCLSKMSIMNEYLTFKANYTRGGEGGLSRTAQFLRYCVAQMEQLRMIKIYRTPTMLRHACSMMVHIGAVLLAPYFVHIGVCDDNWEPCPGPYVMQTTYIVICMLLLNVQAAVEQPFDMSGPDDVFLELAEEFNAVSRLHMHESIYDKGDCFAAAGKAPSQSTDGVAAQVHEAAPVTVR